MTKREENELEKLEDLDYKRPEEIYRIAILKGENPKDAAENAGLKYKIKSNGKVKIRKRIARPFKEVYNRPFFLDIPILEMFLHIFFIIPILGHIPYLLLVIAEYIPRKVLGIIFRR